MLLSAYIGGRGGLSKTTTYLVDDLTNHVGHVVMCLEVSGIVDDFAK